MGTTGAMGISPERARNQDQEDAIEVFRGPGHTYTVPVRVAVDDRKEVDRQFVRRQTCISLEDSPIICGGVPYWCIEFRIDRFEKCPGGIRAGRSRFLPNVGDSLCVAGKSGGTDRAGYWEVGSWEEWWLVG